MTSSTTSGRLSYWLPGLYLRPDARVAVHWQTVVLCFEVLFAWSAFGWLAIAQHHAYNTHAYDLSWFDQTAWNTARGQWLSNSFSHGTYFKEHFSPVLLLFGLAYRFWSGPETLLFLQAAVASLASIPLFVGAGTALRSRTAALLIATAYILAPHLHGYLLFDFHPDIVGVVFMFTAFAFLVAGQPKASLASLLPVALVKEEAALVGFAFAVFFWSQHQRRYALWLLALTAVYAGIAEAVIVGIPHLLHWGTTGEQARYHYLLAAGVHAPEQLWAHLSGPLQREAMAYLAASQALLPLAGIGAVALAPDVLVNVLADHKPQLQLTLQYGLYPLALALMASLINMRGILASRRAEAAWRWLRVPPEWRALILAGALLTAEVVSWLIGSPIGLHFDAARFRTTAHTAAIERVIQALPPGASVSAQSSILPHISHRANIREFPFIDFATYLVVDRKGFVAWDADVAGYQRVLENLPGIGYCRLVQDDGVELWVVRGSADLRAADKDCRG